MDPRHPELAVSRIKELIKQYDEIEDRMAHATTSAQLSQAEREGGLVIQEICLVAPRIHEAMMQASRQRRHDLAHGVLDEPQDTLVEMPHDGYLSVDEAIEEIPTLPNQAETVIVEPKPRKKKTTKKKKAE